MFFDELKNLFESGLNLTETLDTLQSPLAKELRMALRQGKTLSAALNEKNIEPEIACLLRSAEHCGNLSAVFGTICNYYESRKFIREKIIHLLLYPSVTLGFAAIILIFFFSIVMPRFQGVYQSLGIPPVLPALPKYIVLASLFLLSVLIIYRKNILTKFYQNKYFKMYQQSYLFYILAIVINSTELPGLIWQIAPRHPFKNKLYEVAFQLKNGNILSRALYSVGLIDKNQQARLAYAEHGKNLPAFLWSLAKETERQFLKNLDKIFLLVEPLLIFGVGLFIGGISLQIILPVVKLTQNLI